MSKFGGSNNKKEVPSMTSSSLSDIVFMLLFFFMVTTQMRETENKVIVKIPEASEVVKLERKDLNSYINIGTPIKSLQDQHRYSYQVSAGYVRNGSPYPAERLVQNHGRYPRLYRCGA